MTSKPIIIYFIIFFGKSNMFFTESEKFFQSSDDLSGGGAERFRQQAEQPALRLSEWRAPDPKPCAHAPDNSDHRKYSQAAAADVERERQKRQQVAGAEKQVSQGGQKFAAPQRAQKVIEQPQRRPDRDGEQQLPELDCNRDPRHPNNRRSRPPDAVS